MAEEATQRRRVSGFLATLPLTGVVMLLLVAWVAAFSGSDADEAAIELCSGAEVEGEPCRLRADALASVDDGADGDDPADGGASADAPANAPAVGPSPNPSSQDEPAAEQERDRDTGVTDSRRSGETGAADAAATAAVVPSSTPAPTARPSPTPRAPRPAATPSATPSQPTPTPTTGATPTRSELGGTPTATPSGEAAAATPVPSPTASSAVGRPGSTPTPVAPTPTTIPATPAALPPTPTATAAPSPTAPTGSTVALSGPQPVGRPGAWTLIFEDNFDYLDQQTWETAWFSSFDYTPPVNSVGGACFHPSQVSVVGGDLQLRIDPIDDPRCLRQDGVTSAEYVAGLVNTRESFAFSYGYAEARVFLPSAAGSLDNWAAFWHTGFDWPRTGEVDIVEGLSGGQPCSVYHWAGAGGEHLQTKRCVNWPEPGGWHVFAADWQPGRITFYYDGVEVFTTTEGVTGDPHYLILNYTVRANGEGTAAPSTMAVDYVRVWQN